MSYDVNFGMWFPTIEHAWVAMNEVTLNRNVVKPEYKLRSPRERTWLHGQTVNILCDVKLPWDAHDRQFDRELNTMRRRATNIIEALDPAYASLVQVGLLISPDEVRDGAEFYNVFLHGDAHFEAIKNVSAYTARTATGLYASLTGGFSPKNHRPRHPDANATIRRAVLDAVKIAKTRPPPT